jgi:phage terminase large subunit-like protein
MSDTHSDGPRERALDRLASLVLANGQPWGEAAANFQWEDAEAVLDPYGKPRCFYLTRSRGSSKTTDLAGVLLAVMLEQAPPGSRLYAQAADLGQALLLLDLMRGFCGRTPGLKGLVSFTETRAVTASGVVFEVLAADAAGTWGLQPYFLVLDEVSQWSETRRSREIFFAASTASIKVDGRMVILTTAGRPSHWACEVLEHARGDPIWHVHEVAGPAPWLSPTRLESERGHHPPSVYKRLFENEWTEDEDRLAAIADVKACVREDQGLEPGPGRSYFIGVDIGVTNDRTAVVVLHCERLDPSANSRSIRRVVVDRVLVWAGSPTSPVQLSEVEATIFELARAYNSASFVLDPHEGIGMAQRLRTAGFRVTKFNFSATSVGQLAATVIHLLRHGLLSLPNDPELVREIERVRLVEHTPGVIRMDHDRGDHDDRTIALALAATEALRTPVPYRGPRVLIAPQPPPRYFGGWQLR